MASRATRTLCSGAEGARREGGVIKGVWGEVRGSSKGVWEGACLLERRGGRERLRCERLAATLRRRRREGWP